MQVEWWYASGGKRKGPISTDVLRQKLFEGSVTTSDLVWTEGMSEWTAVCDVPVLNKMIQALPPELPKTAVPEPSVPFVATKPSPLLASSAPAPVPASAGPWRRFCARFVDLWVIGLPTGVLLVFFLEPIWPAFALWLEKPSADVALGFLILPLELVIEAIIFELFGTTVGKSLLGIHVRTLAGQKPSFSQYLHRQFGCYFAGLGVGFPLVVLFTHARQYRRLKNGLPASYDEKTFVVTAEKIGVFRYVLAAAAVALILIVSSILQMVSTSSGKGNEKSVSTNDWGNSNDIPVSKPSQPIVSTPQPPVANSTIDAGQPESEYEKQVREHFNTILVAHPDFRTIAQTDAFKQWVSNSPERRRISETGTTNEVVLLLHEYKNYSRQTGSNPFEHRKQLTEAERARNEAAYEALARRN